ncbi:ATP-binding cassette domain-containing protein [Microbacterium sp. Root166]|uniref:ATP-binding cassette domain-containing protein n=1 Tax=Microbacterium sp. Root166 TaxID=1736478 RepID=UPI0009EA0827|nr:ATP-binding cassette domain-containing protein [Microbacterium sp. Root166]
MPEGQVLEFSGVTKRFGAVTAVSGLTARVEPGVVTGFLGPNGAGKTTSLRILLGLVRATDGAATIGGERYAKLANPMQTVGAVLEASSFHPGRTGAAHLNVYAQAGRIPKGRVDEVLGLVGLDDAAGRKVGGYSLGMRQRLGLAYALLGDPGVLVLDEPTNGLDPEGIKWIRGFLRELAREGRTVFVSSHLLSEVQQTVDSLLIISRGRLVFQGGLEDLADPEEQATVVDAPDRAALAEALRASELPFEVLRSGLTVRGVDPIEVGRAAAASGIALSSLQRRGPVLEEVFLDLVDGIRVHPSAAGEPADAAGVTAIEAGAAGIAAEAALADAEPDGVDEVIAAAPVAESEDAEAEHVADAPAAAAVLESTGTDGESDAAPAVAGDPELEEPEPSPETVAPASFAVASTGVIDIIPTDVGPEPEAEHGADEGVEAEDEAEEDADEPAEQVEAEPEQDPADPDDVEEHVVSDADDRPWEDYVKTDADVEADRFFAGFTESPGPSGDDAATADPDADEPPGDDQAADDGAVTGDHEGSEQR